MQHFFAFVREPLVLVFTVYLQHNWSCDYYQHAAHKYYTSILLIIISAAVSIHYYVDKQMSKYAETYL